MERSFGDHVRQRVVRRELRKPDWWRFWWRLRQVFDVVRGSELRAHLEEQDALVERILGRVDVPLGRLDAGVTEELLHDAERDLLRGELGREGMPECVPADAWHPCPVADLVEVLPGRCWRQELSIGRSHEHEFAFVPEPPELRDERGPERHLPVTSGLREPDDVHSHTSADVNGRRRTVEHEIFPAERGRLAETGAGAHEEEHEASWPQSGARSWRR